MEPTKFIDFYFSATTLIHVISYASPLDLKLTISSIGPYDPSTT